jgi:hypothetical protein
MKILYTYTVEILIQILMFVMKQKLNTVGIWVNIYIRKLF